MFYLKISINHQSTSSRKNNKAARDTGFSAKSNFPRLLIAPQREAA